MTEAARSTYDALVWSLIYNQHPTDVVRKANMRRLAQLSDRQLEELIAAFKRQAVDPIIVAFVEGLR